MNVSKLDELIDSSNFIEKSQKEDCKKYFKEIDRGLGDWFYANSIPSDKYQGDIVDNLDVVYFEMNENQQEAKLIENIPCMLLSHTCDMALEGKTRCSYISIAPIVCFEEFAESRVKGYTKETRENFLEAVRANKITDILYIPRRGPLKESIVFLDRICSIEPQVLQMRLEKNRSKRILSLSQIGHYLFLFKLSIHFARYEDKTEIVRQ
jgi:hypothetical protein